jgi:outer membrane protein assembly factor BamB
MRSGRQQLRWVAVLAGVLAVGAAPALASSRSPDLSALAWPAFLDGPAHSSYNPSQQAITPANAASLVQKWNFAGDPATMPGQPAPGFVSSPVVADEAVFIGSSNGYFYKLDEKTGAVLAKRFIGFQPALTCQAGGFADTATVAKDPSTGQLMVYVGGPDGYLYAMNASDLAVKWRSVIGRPSRKVNDYFQWSSPTVVNGRIYIGVSSACDQPQVRGGVKGYLQATGKVFARFYSVPKGVLGGSVWSSVAAGNTAGNKDIYFGTGNYAPGVRRRYYMSSVVELNALTLKVVATFGVPKAQQVVDDDFGASPTLFGALVGDCDKNGHFYALKVPSMQLAWQAKVANLAGPGDPQCVASAAYDGKSLYITARNTTIGGKSYQGSIRKLNAQTGAVAWQTPLPNGAFGTPTLDGAGVLAVGTYDFTDTDQAVYLLNAATGSILASIPADPTFAQSVFANGWMFTASGSGVTAWAPPAS